MSLRLIFTLLLFGFLFCSSILAQHPAPFFQNWDGKWPREDKVLVTSDFETFQEPGPDYRLPNSLIPKNYFLRIRPIIDKDYPGIGVKNTAQGFVRLTTSCNNATERVVLHAKFLTINESSIQIKSTGSGNIISVTSLEYDEARNFMVIKLASFLVKNEDYEISMDFTANVPPNDSLRGLYSEEYLDPRTNQTKVMAVTQLEPLRARQVFPCMDEPTYKATFDVVIGRTENFSSLCNGPLLSTEANAQNPGWFWDTFKTTVKMPTYLFAMGVSEYSYSEAATGLYRLPVRIYGPQHLVEEGRAQLTANGSAMLMKQFESKYGIPHNMPKVDSISVPLKRGAMENYGLITYGESRLMYFEGKTLTSELRRWSDIYLNEGFATYVSYAEMDALWPEFEMTNYMLHDTVNVALQYDASASSHPLHQEAYTAEQIGVNMDTIGYDKGASVVRMMVSFLGEETFYNGIKQYLTRLSDSVAEQDDLFEDLTDSANCSGLELPKTVAEIMHTWTLQAGFPLVRVTLETPNIATFSQETWQNDDVRNESDPKTSWNLPIVTSVHSSAGEFTSLLWLLQNEGSVSLPMPSGNSWLIANSDAGGYYRTLYDDELSKRILQQLQTEPTIMSPAARLRLLDDQFHLGFQKYVPIEAALEFTKYLKNEVDNAVWSSVFGNLFKVRYLMNSNMTTQFAALRSYLLPKVDSALEAIGGNNFGQAPSSAVAILASQLVDWSCGLNSASCFSFLESVYDEWSNNPEENSVPNDLQKTLYCKTVENFAAYGLAYALYNSTSDRVQKDRLANALACTQEINVVPSLYQMIVKPVDGAAIDKVDSIPVFQGLLINPVTRLMFLQLVEANIETLFDFYGGSVSSLVQIFSPIEYTFSTDEEIKRFEDFISETEQWFDGALDSTLKGANENNKWMVEYSSRLTAWFTENSN